MGSIAVIHSRSAAPYGDRVNAMLEAAPHRGTEFEVDGCGRTTFGVSNDPGWRDAWLAREGESAGVFAGVLDNMGDVVRELNAEGVVLQTENPAHVVLAAFRTWGDEAPARFRGLFSGAVTDGYRLRCFRDHLGFRTFFYRDDPEAFYAATEAKQVIAGAGISREPNLEWLELRLFHLSAGLEAALRGVTKFPRASTAVIEHEEAPAFTPYWDPDELLESAPLSVDEACERLVVVFEQVVKRMTTGADAVLLSGGLDSPMIAAFAAAASLERSGRPLLAVSAVFPDLPSVDERRYVELVAERFGLPLHAYRPSAKSLDDLDFWVRLLDAPVDTLSVPEIAESYRQARALGARTVLTGELAEYVLTMRHHLLAYLILHGRLNAAVRRMRQERGRGRAWSTIMRSLTLSLAPPIVATRYARWRRRNFRNLPSWLDAATGGFGDRSDLQVPARRRWSETTLGPTGAGGTSPTFEADDICAAYCGVHTRRPFADVDFWEFALSLRAETKFPDGFVKGLQRRALDGYLPDEIVRRQDRTGFASHMVATADYPALRRWILGSSHRMAGVDYKLLAERLEDESLAPLELNWARDLARIHAFLETFE